MQRRRSSSRLGALLFASCHMKLMARRRSTIKSPQILELSGIGRREILEKAGIAVKVDLRGVGENLQEHCMGRYNFGTLACLGSRPSHV